MCTIRKWYKAHVSPVYSITPYLSYLCTCRYYDKKRLILISAVAWCPLYKIWTKKKAVFRSGAQNWPVISFFSLPSNLITLTRHFIVLYICLHATLVLHHFTYLFGLLVWWSRLILKSCSCLLWIHDIKFPSLMT